MSSETRSERKTSDSDVFLGAKTIKSTTKLNKFVANGIDSLDLDSEFDGLMHQSSSIAVQTMDKLNILRKNRQLCDLILQLDDDSQDIYCHQVILACNSKFFMEIFNSYESEKYSHEVMTNGNSISQSTTSLDSVELSVAAAASRGGSMSPTSTVTTTASKSLKKLTLQSIVKANHNSTQRQLLFCLSDYLKHYLKDDSLHHDAKLNSVINHNSHYHHHYHSKNSNSDKTAASSHHEEKHQMNQNLDYEALKICIEYMYTSQLKVPSYLIPHVYTLAYHLSFDLIVQACVDYLLNKLNVDNCLSIRSFALDEQLIEASTQCIDKNIEYILQLGRSTSCSNLSETESAAAAAAGALSASNGSAKLPYISSTLNLAHKEFNHLPRVNIELVGLKQPINKLPDNLNSLTQLCMNWLVDQYQQYSDDKESYLNDLCNHMNMLYIHKSDLTLHDCCDMDSSDVGFNDQIHDYQQSHQVNNLVSASNGNGNGNGNGSTMSLSGSSSCKSRKNSTRQSPSAALLGNALVGENVRLKTFKITDHELNSIGTATPIKLKVPHENEIICTHQTNDYSFVTICTLAGRLVNLCIHILPVGELNESFAAISLSQSTSAFDADPAGCNKELDSQLSTNSQQSAATTPGESTNNMILYSKQNSIEYSKMVKMAVARCSHGCIAYENRLFIIGGFERGECISACEVFDPTKNRVDLVEPLQNRRGRAAIVWFEKESSIYVIGGSDGQQDLNSIENLDMRSMTWKKTKFDFDLGCINIAAASGGDFIYLIGLKGDTGKSNSCLRYEPAKVDFKRLADLNNARSQSALVSVSLVNENETDSASAKDYLLIFGGHDQIRCLSSCEIYDIEQDKWSLLPSMSETRRGCGAAVHKETLHVYIVGGTNGTQSLKSCECYDIRAKKWSKLPDMNMARNNVAIAFIGHILFAVGGFDGKSFLRTIEYFDIKNPQNGWSMFHKPVDFEFLKPLSQQ